MLLAQSASPQRRQSIAAARGEAVSTELPARARRSSAEALLSTATVRPSRLNPYC